MSETYVIGDVHGCYHTLVTLLEKIPSEAECIFVGDLCDRGLFSKEVISLVIERGDRSILGNHEDFMLEHIESAIMDPLHSSQWTTERSFGGKTTVASYRNDPVTLAKHLAWIRELPRFIEIDHYFITHGFGLPYYQRRNDNSNTVNEGLLKNRVDDEISWGYTWERGWRSYEVINIFGHTVNEQVTRRKNWIDIDTGCGYGMRLSAIKLGSEEVLDVEVDPRDFGQTVCI